MGLGELVKGHGDQMGHDHKGDEKERKMDLHVGLKVEAEDTPNKDHGDLSYNNRKFPPVNKRD